MDEFKDYANEFVINVVEEAEYMNGLPPRRVLQNRNAFEMSDQQFIRYFRLDKLTVEELMQDLTPFLEPPTRVPAVVIPTKVLVSLRFLQLEVTNKILDQMFIWQ